ncbi:MAG: alpha-amylase family glycosyl hydrolase, partial [Myxococcota bacterium]
MSPETRPRVATYRLQLHAGFTLDDAAALLDYLAELGISHVYLSPYLQSTPGSSHGYDVVDPAKVDQDRGGEVAFGRLCRALRRTGMQQLLDIVPNHMGIGTRHNRWWWDVLEKGPHSPFAASFDLDWGQVVGRRPRLLLPCLARPYGEELSRGVFRLMNETYGFTVRYKDREFPLSRQCTEIIHAYSLELSKGTASGRRASLVRLVQALETLAGPGGHIGSADVAPRLSPVAVLMSTSEGEQQCEMFRRALTIISNDHSAMHAVLEAQHYRLASHVLA